MYTNIKKILLILSFITLAPRFNKVILYMKNILFAKSLICIIILTSSNAWSQKTITGVSTINASDLESHLAFLASPLLKGRLNGSPELEIAAGYIAAQAKKTGLKPVSGNSYYYPYTVIKKTFDAERTFIEVKTTGGESAILKEPLYQLFPQGASDFEIEGEVVFVGYGIKSDQDNYDDFDTLNLSGKILVAMTRAPMTPDGKKCQFEDQKWLTLNTNLQMKLQGMMMRRPKAILFVPDPKSDADSFAELYPGFTEYYGSSMNLKGAKSQSFDIPGIPKVIMVHSKVADEILKGTGNTLAELQNAIDSDLKCHSFLIKNKTLRINEVSASKEIQLPNVAGIIEGSDPVLKNEVVIFSGHMDHIGGEGVNVKPGADDDASGCSALLELAEAFQSLPKKPLRSVMFLWVSGEEIGLFGSESYVNNPVFPLDKTVADLNIDMIGRIWSEADTLKDRPVSGPNEVFVITDDQSKELVAIADAVSKKNNLKLDYSQSGKNHPQMLFIRSDHFNFVKKNIPILFFTTGEHADYHKTGDVIEKINFRNMELITKTMFEIGFQVANKKTRIVVDNPFSKWQNNQFKQF